MNDPSGIIKTPLVVVFAVIVVIILFMILMFLMNISGAGCGLQCPSLEKPGKGNSQEKIRSCGTGSGGLFMGIENMFSTIIGYIIGIPIIIGGYMAQFLIGDLAGTIGGLLGGIVGSITGSTTLGQEIYSALHNVGVNIGGGASDAGKNIIHKATHIFG